MKCAIRIIVAAVVGTDYESKGLPPVPGRGVRGVSDRARWDPRW